MAVVMVVRCCNNKVYNYKMKGIFLEKIIYVTLGDNKQKLEGAVYLKLSGISNSYKNLKSKI